MHSTHSILPAYKYSRIDKAVQNYGSCRRTKINKLNLMIKRFVFLPELIIQGNGVKTSRKCNAASAKSFAYVEPYQQKINTFPPVLKGSELRT